ncbi:MAG TPA: hypothetical protein VFE23_02715 [Usitatibacter sp.]|jgi:hypothetical protein|nr:hypothetical protein [Usitatibacter sp.]
MNRLTAIGLASLVAYGFLVATKYAGVVSIARERDPTPIAKHDEVAPRSSIVAMAPPEQVHPKALAMPAPLPRIEPTRASAVAVDFRATRDLRAFADALEARRPYLTADERYFLAKALEECQFATTVNEDLAAYSARQRNAFLATLTQNDPINRKRIAAYDAMDNSQRCLRFQGTKISSKEIEDLMADAAQEGDPRAQARLLIADITNKVNGGGKADGSGTTSRGVNVDDVSQLIRLLETRDPETTMQVGNFLASSAMVSQLRIGPQGETPEPSALLGAFSLVACQQGPDCISMTKDPQAACAYGAYCDATSYEQLFQNFLASPWVYSNAARYSSMIMTAINSQNWALIGLQPPEKRKLLSDVPTYTYSYSMASMH